MNLGNEFLNLIETCGREHDTEFLVLHRGPNFGPLTIPFDYRVGFFTVDFLGNDCLPGLEINGAQFPFAVHFAPLLELGFGNFSFPVSN